MDRHQIARILDASPDTYMIIDRAGVIIDFHPSRCFTPLVPPEEFLGRPMMEVLPGDLAEAALEKVRGVFENGTEGLLEYDLPGDGGTRYYEARLTPFDDTSVLAVIRDVSERKRSVQAAQALIDASDDLFILLDREGGVMAVNRGVAGLFGRTSGQMVGSSCWDWKSPELAVISRERLEVVFRSGEPSQYIDFSENRYFEVSCNPVRETGGPVRYAACFVKDITDRVRAERELIQSEDRYRRLFQENPVPMYIYDTDTMRILDANTAMIERYGYTRQELTSMTISDIRPPEDIPRLLRNVSDLRDRQVYLGTWRHRKKDGSVIDVEVTSNDFPFKGRPARLVLCNDITDKLQAGKALEESEEKFRTAFITSPDSVNINRLCDGEFVDINEGFTQIMGYSREEAIGRTSLDLGIWVDSGDRQRLIDELTKKGYVHNLESRFRARDGVVLDGLMSAKIINLRGEQHILSITRDITDIKRTQKALLKSEEQLRASLGEKEILLKEIHHRVKNNLQVISGLLDFQAHHIDDPHVRELYRDSQNRVITMAIIHEELYNSSNLSEVDLEEYIRELCGNLMISYGADKDRITLDIRADKAEIVVDTAIPLGLIINELITNCLKHAFPDGRRGTISLTFNQLRNKDYVLTVVDDGVGMPASIDIDNSSTIGMQLVTVMVRQLGGTIEVAREKGTRFDIRFKEYHEAGSILY